MFMADYLSGRLTVTQDYTSKKKNKDLQNLIICTHTTTQTLLSTWYYGIGKLPPQKKRKINIDVATTEGISDTNV